MKIGIIGYGKMGKMIEQILLQRNHSIAYIIDDKEKRDQTDLKSADVVIEFSHPEAAFDNIVCCLKDNVPVVCGTTGWYQHLPEAYEICKKHNGAMIATSNYSLGVNLFFAVNDYLARLMNAHKDYDVSINEIHHTAKKDAPSGTAISLAEGILHNMQRKNKWINQPSTHPNDLSIISQRIGDVPGTHSVLYENNIDEITITHRAKNREGFALGSVIAAEYIVDKKGIFSMKDVLGI